MGVIDKLQSLFILMSVALGLVLGRITFISNWADMLIVPFLMVMLLVVFLHIPLRDLRHAFGNMRFTALSLGINFVWTPVFAWLLGLLFLKNTPDLWVGFLMLLVTPCTDWYLVFTQLAQGNVRLGATLLPWHLILQLLLLPLYLFIFAGATPGRDMVPIQPQVLLESIVLVLIIPLAAASLLRWAVRRSRGPGWLETVFLPNVASGQTLFLCLAISAMFASQGAILLEHPGIVLPLILPLLLFFTINLGLALIIGRRVGLDHPACISLCFATLARNSPVALAVAVTAFPHRPLIPLALVVGPLLELPILAVISQILQSLPKWRPSLKLDMHER